MTWVYGKTIEEECKIQNSCW